MKIKSQLLLSAAFIIVVQFSSAAAQDVQWHIPEGTDFSSYTTYKWKRAQKVTYPDSAIDQLLMQAADAQLGTKGLSRTDTENADLYVTYQLAILDDVAWSSFTNEIGWSGGPNSFGGFTGSTTNSAMMIKRGFMVLEVYDVKQKKRIWEAQARKVLKEDKDLKKIEKNSKKAMAKIFKSFPSVR
jgi:hypothetical protein